jgi:class 3 adenylate cyclase
MTLNGRRRTRPSPGRTRPFAHTSIRATLGGVLDRIMGWLYERLGSRYWALLVAGETAVSVFVVLLTVAILSTYYGASVAEAGWIALTGCGLTVLAVLWAAMQAREAFDTVQSWRRATAPGAQLTVDAWEAATTLTLRQYRRNSWWVNASVVLPTVAVTIVLLDLGWTDFLVVLLACLVPAAYATVLSYSVGETLSRPLVADIAAALPDDFAFERHGLPVAKRIRLGLPTYTVATGIVVAAIVGDRDGSHGLLLAVLAALVVGLSLSQELAILLARGITEPITRVRRALDQVAAGDLSARVPVTTSDELGQLAHDFNLMARGLQEREHMRAAFGTYMDKEVARLILSGQFPEEGVEVDVSILFCDVRGFTSYAEQAPATEVIATLNRLFELIVPIVDRHGGHVDKFIGDGLLAVFGAPEPYPDHADRAVATACEIVATAAAGSGLSVGVGVNTGPVVAGSIGGAGRLNFSVIGDAVNVAARVEAATRQTGDDVLVTAATRQLLVTAPPMVSRGTVALKGKAEPIEVFAPVAPVGAPGGDAAASTGR